MRRGVWLLAACAALSLTGCGQKGALYLPDKGAEVITTPPASPEPAQPAPAAQPPPPTPPSPQPGEQSDDSGAPK